MPDDAKEITASRRDDLIDDEANGKEIYGDNDGYPQSRERTFSDAELIEKAKHKRNSILRESDYTQIDDSQKDKIAWRAYRKHLRDIPDQPGFPQTIDWGVEPD